MPNICENTMTVTGPKAEIDRFKAKAQGKRGPFEMCNFKPTPKELNDRTAPNYDDADQILMIERHGHPDWHY